MSCGRSCSKQVPQDPPDPNESLHELVLFVRKSSAKAGKLLLDAGVKVSLRLPLNPLAAFKLGAILGCPVIVSWPLALLVEAGVSASPHHSFNDSELCRLRRGSETSRCD